jgi:transposase
MPQRKKDTLEIRQLLLHLRAHRSEREISHDTGLARDTIRRYKKWAKQHQLLDSETLPEPQPLQCLLDSTLPPLLPPQNTSSVQPYADLVATLLEQKVEMAALHARLQERGYEGSYSSVYRYVGRLRPKEEPDLTVRVETAPGYEAQVDFGEVGMFLDPATSQPRKAYAFVMTLGYSRHLYAELVFDQKVLTWLAAHTRALAYFGGVPQRLVIDNLKAGIQKAAWDDPEVNRAYAELAEHYGFLIAPCRPRTPQHKGKVESGVHFVQRNFIAGREPGEIGPGNRDLLAWCVTVSQRKHGTTHKKPRTLFDAHEKAALQPLPSQAYDLGVYKRVKLHRDCHVTFDNAYYSAPCRLVGSTLWARGGLTTVRLLTDDHLIVATHERAAEPGQRRTHLDHLPAEKAAALPRTPACLKEQAHQVGTATSTVVETLLSHPHLDKTASAGRLLRLADKHSPARLEAACERAVRYGDPCYTTVRDILSQGLEAEPTPQPQAPPATTFARSARELFAQFKGGLSWM